VSQLTLRPSFVAAGAAGDIRDDVLGRRDRPDPESADR